MAADENEDVANEEVDVTIQTWLQKNKLNNSELLSALLVDGISNESDLKDHFEDESEIEAIIKATRKRTEKILKRFSETIAALSGIQHVYKPPRTPRNKVPKNASHKANNDSYLSPVESPNFGARNSRKKNKRSSSNISNISNGSIRSRGSVASSSSRGQPSKSMKELKVEANAASAFVMKEWLQKRNIFHKDLFDHLASNGFDSPDALADLTQKQFDYLVRQVRVETFKEVKDREKRNRVDKLLVKFEKEWRKFSGIRKTNMTKEQQEQWGYSPRQQAQNEDDGFDDDDVPDFSLDASNPASNNENDNDNGDE